MEKSTIFCAHMVDIRRPGHILKAMMFYHWENWSCYVISSYERMTVYVVL